MSGAPVAVFQPENIPRELRELTGRWAVWGYIEHERQPGRFTKPPLDPTSGYPTSNATAWWSFDEAVAAVHSETLRPVAPLAGVGFLMLQKPEPKHGRATPPPHQIAMLDLDHAIDEHDRERPWVLNLLSRLSPTYLERSPSGKGLRVIMRAPIDAANRSECTRQLMLDGRQAGIEIYYGHAARYLTITGDEHPLSTGALGQMTPEQADLLEAMVARPQERATTRLSSPDRSIPQLAADERVAAAWACLDHARDDLRAWLEHGLTMSPDLSRVLASAAIELLNLTASKDGAIDPGLVLAMLRSNSYAWDVCMRHRGGDEGKALVYLWEHHVKPGTLQAAPTGGDFAEAPPVPGEPLRRPEDGASPVDTIGNPVHLAEFYADGESNKFILTRNNAFWPSQTLDARFPKLTLGGRELRPSVWVHRTRSVEQTTWIPVPPDEAARGPVMLNRLFTDGDLVASPGSRMYNLYRPPRRASGNGSAAGRWVDHVHRLYPESTDHLINWFAFKAQHPDVKINHAIVLGGRQGIGKDTLLAPVIEAVGRHNVAEIGPAQVFKPYNKWMLSVLLRISEARDQGGWDDRYRFYEHTKTIIAAPPDVIRVEEKFEPAVLAPNVCGVIMTTNYTTFGGLYLPPDDRRHYVAGSVRETGLDEGAGQLPPSYFTGLWNWLNSGGYEDVAAYLRGLDVTGFNPAEPPPMTAAKRQMIESHISQDHALVAALIDELSVDGERPKVFTIAQLKAAGEFLDEEDLGGDLRVLGAKHKLAMIMESLGYVVVNYRNSRDGKWLLSGGEKVRAKVYARMELSYPQVEAEVKQL